jgi:hypothetical protein
MTIPGIDLSQQPAASIPPRLTLSPLDAQVLRATDPLRERTAQHIATMIDCSQDVARSCLRRLRGRMLVEPDGRRPTGWLRTHDGDLALEHQP